MSPLNKLHVLSIFTKTAYSKFAADKRSYYIFEDLYTADIQYQPGRQNLRSFLAVNLTQNYFLIARMLSFCDIRDKSAVFNILRQSVTIFDIGNG